MNTSNDFRYDRMTVRENCSFGKARQATPRLKHKKNLCTRSGARRITRTQFFEHSKTKGILMGHGHIGESQSYPYLTPYPYLEIGVRSEILGRTVKSTVVASVVYGRMRNFQ